MSIYTIYRITNLVNGKVYIGFTSKNPNVRWNRHITISRNPDFPDHYYIHSAIRKYGVDKFVFEPIYQSRDKVHTLTVMEQYFMDEYNAEYNISKGGTAPNIGRKVSEETKSKIRVTLTGRSKTEEARVNLSIALTGKKKSAEHAAKIGAGHAKDFLITYPDGTEETITNLSSFCRTNLLNPSLMQGVASGNRIHHKGFKCIRL